MSIALFIVPAGCSSPQPEPEPEPQESVFEELERRMEEAGIETEDEEMTPSEFIVKMAYLVNDCQFFAALREYGENRHVLEAKLEESRKCADSRIPGLYADSRIPELYGKALASMDKVRSTLTNTELGDEEKRKAALDALKEASEYSLTAALLKLQE